jgi:ABC-type phosphate/phosphonate transport system permease subunit
MWLLANVTEDLSRHSTSVWTAFAQIIAALLIALTVQRSLPGLLEDRKALEDFLTWQNDLRDALKSKDKERIEQVKDRFPQSSDPALAYRHLRGKHARIWRSAMTTVVVACVGLVSSMLMLVPIGIPPWTAWIALVVSTVAVFWMLAAIVQNLQLINPRLLDARTREQRAQDLVDLLNLDE